MTDRKLVEAVKQVMHDLEFHAEYMVIEEGAERTSELEKMQYAFSALGMLLELCDVPFRVSDEAYDAQYSLTMKYMDAIAQAGER